MSTVTIDLVAETRRLVSGIDQATGRLSKLGRGAVSTGSILKGALVGGAIFKGLDALTQGFSEAAEAVKLQESLAAQTGAVLESTGGAAGVTATAVTKLADSIERKSMLDAEAVQQGQNLLLTFTNIKNAAGKGNDVFNQTTQIMADMATAMGSEPKASAIQLGKALNDPIKGISALSKVGVSFSEDQKNVIKSLVESGDVMGAQKVILKELNKEFGGSAKAAGETTAGQFKHFKDMVDGAFESILKTAIPVLLKLANFLTKNLPLALAAVQPYTDKLRDAFSKLTPVFSTVFDFLKNNKTVVAAFAGSILLIVGSFTLLNAVMAVNPISLVVIAIAGLVAGLVYAYNNVEGFRNVVNSAWASIKSATQAAWPAIKAAVTDAINIIKTVISAGVAVATAVWRTFGSILTSFAAKSLGNVVTVVRGAFKVISGVFKVVSSVLKGDWAGAWDGIKSILSGAVGIIKGLVKQLGNVVVTILKVAWAALKTVASVAFEAMKNAISNKIDTALTLVRGIKGGITTALSGLGSLLYNAGQEIIQGLINGVTEKAKQLYAKFQEITKKIPDWKGPMSKDKVLLKPTGQAIMQGLLDGLVAGEEGVTTFLAGVTTSVEKFYDTAFKKAAKNLSKQMKEAGKGPENIKKALEELEKKYDKKPTKLLKGFKEQTKALTAQGKAIDANAAKLKEAQDSLAALQQQAADYAKSVRDSFADYGNITSLNSAFNAGSLIDALKARLVKAQKFAAVVQQLISMNVNETTLQQIISAGVEGGLAVAEALAAGGTGAVAEVNSLQAQLQAAGQGLGNSAANTLYGAGIQAAQGLVAGLQSQQDVLIAQMRDMAAAMVKALRKELRIKSPSRVFARLGEFTTAGLAQGLSETQAVERAAAGMGNAVVTGYGSPTLTTTTTGSGSAQVSGGDTINITINAMTGNGKQIMKEVDEWLVLNTGKRLQTTAA